MHLDFLLVFSRIIDRCDYVCLNSVVKKSQLLLCAVSAVVLAPSSYAGLFNFTFDSDNQGWTRGNLGSTFSAITPSSAGAAAWSAGTIVGSDHASYAFNFSPVLSGGFANLLGGTINVDFASPGGANGSADPFIVLVSGTDFLIKGQQVPGSSTLSTYSYALNSTGGWYFNSSPYYQGGAAVLATDSQILSVLGDLQHVGVSSDIVSGGDDVRIDNVGVVEAVPEPATLAVLGLGLGALRLRKRRS